MERLRLGELVVRLGLLSPRQLEMALGYQSRWNCKLGEALVALRLLTAEQVLRALARQLQVPFIRGEEMAKVPAAVVGLVPREVLARLRVLPLRAEWRGSRGTLHVATHEPRNLTLLDALSFATGLTASPVLALPEDIERALLRLGVLGSRPVDPIDLAPEDDGLRLEITRGGEL